MTAEEILQDLDTQFEVVHHDPPHLYQLWTHFYPADTRLTVFRSFERWAIVFEILGYWSRPQTPRLDIYVYGDRGAEQTARYESTPLKLLDTQNGTPLDGTGSVDPRHFSVLWNDQRYDFKPTDRDYSEGGIVFDATRSDPDAHANAQIVRYLCERLNHPFFLPEEKLHDLLVQSGAGDERSRAEAMTLLLQTHVWHHPDLSQEEMPSQLNSFQILAHALETGDISEWGLQNPVSFNTDWRIYDWAEKADEEQRLTRETRQEGEWDSLTPEMRARIAEETASETPRFILLPDESEFPRPDQPQ